MSRHHSMSLDKRKLEQSLIWVHGSVFSKLVYFGQEGLKILTTVYNCFITLRFILIGTSKVSYFAECQSCGMCCSPVCTQVHSRVALGRGRCKWSDRGLGGADTSHRTNHLLLSSAAFGVKKRQGKDRKRWAGVWGGVGRGPWWKSLDAKCSNYLTLDCISEEIYSYIENLRDSFCFILKDSRSSPARSNYGYCKKTTIKSNFTIFYRIRKHIYTLRCREIMIACVILYSQKWGRTSTRTKPWAWSAMLKIITNMSTL